MIPWLVLTEAASAGPAVDLGVGPRYLQNPFDETPLCLGVAGRLAFPRLALEADLAVRPWPSTGVSDLAQTLVLIAYEGNSETTFFQPIRRELGSVSLRLDASPFPRPEEKGLSVWPYAIVGLDARLTRDDRASLNPDYPSDDPEASPAVLSTGAVGIVGGPELGLGFDLWLGRHFGARIHLVGRAAVEEEPDYGNKNPDGTPVELESQLYVDSLAGLDFLVRL